MADELMKSTPCAREATIGNTAMRCENHAEHDGPCWYNAPAVQAFVSHGSFVEMCPATHPSEDAACGHFRCELDAGHSGAHSRGFWELVNRVLWED